MKTLIVDDDALTRDALAAQVRALGHDILLAEDGEQAWDMFLIEHPSVIITDWLMPRVDGPQLCRYVRAEKRQRYTYIIFLTVLTGRDSFLDGMAAGADDFLTKPVDVDQLTSRLHVAERILSLQRDVRELERMLSICAYCKNIRDEGERWVPVADYISKRTDTFFTHGICPPCKAAHSPIRTGAGHGNGTGTRKQR